MRCMETKSDSREGNHMIPFLVGLGLVIGGTLLVKYWKNIVDWLKDFIPKLKMAWKRVRPMLPYAAIIVGDKLWEAGSALVAVMHRLYYKENGEWIEQTTTRKVEESEVPAHIRESRWNQVPSISFSKDSSMKSFHRSFQRRSSSWQRDARRK